MCGVKWLLSSCSGANFIANFIHFSASCDHPNGYQISSVSPIYNYSSCMGIRIGQSSLLHRPLFTKFLTPGKPLFPTTKHIISPTTITKENPFFSGVVVLELERFWDELTCYFRFLNYTNFIKGLSKKTKGEGDILGIPFFFGMHVSCGLISSEIKKASQND